MSATAIRRLRAGFVAAAEGAWVAVVYAALDVGLLHRSGSLGVLAFVVAAAVGLLVGGWGGHRSASGRLPAAAVVLGAALAGLALEHPGTLADGLLLPGPWCLGLAAWGGLRRDDANHDAAAMSTLLARGGPALAIPWLAGSGTTAYLAPALVGTLLFVAAGLAAIGLARLERLELDGGTGAAASGLWIRLLGLVVGGTAIAGLVVAWLVGVPLRALAAVVVGPVVDALAAFGRRAGELLPPASVAGSGALSAGRTSSSAPGPGGLVYLPLWIVAGVMLLLVVSVARSRGTATHRRPKGRPDDEPERTFDGPHLRVHIPHIARPGFLRRSVRPRTATGAYLVVIGSISTDPTLARKPAETVRAHARRIAPTMGHRLNLLAADYERERYGAGTVSPSETRRALRRARELVARSSRRARAAPR